MYPISCQQSSVKRLKKNLTVRRSNKGMKNQQFLFTRYFNTRVPVVTICVTSLCPS